MIDNVGVPLLDFFSQFLLYLLSGCLLLQVTAPERDSWFLPSILSWLGVGSGSDKSSMLVDSCAWDLAWYTYTSLRALEAAQPDMSLDLWTELQIEMCASSTVSAEQALLVCLLIN